MIVEENRNYSRQNNNTSTMYTDEKNEEENNLDTCKTRREMINQIRSYEFAITELTLYLDTHPDDEKALCLHRKDCKEVKELKDRYQKIYGPLTINYPCNKWRWIESPWPWERGNF